MATSISDALPANPLDLLKSARLVETAGGVAIGFVVAGALAYVAQHVIKLQSSTVRGRVYSWCQGAPLAPVTAAGVVAVGTAGPSAGGVYEASADDLGRWTMEVTPGLYVLAVVLPDGRQVPPMVLTPKTASGEVPLPASLELVYDVWAQMAVPPSGEITVDLVVAC